jgi:hypothetical protein
MYLNRLFQQIDDVRHQDDEGAIDDVFLLSSLPEGRGVA